MTYQPGQVLTFANGMVGCITKSYLVALVSPQGWVLKKRPGGLIPLPSLSEYLKTTTVIKAEFLPREI